MSNWPQKRGSAAICYLGAGVRSRDNLKIIDRAMAAGLMSIGARAIGVTADGGRKNHAFLWRRDHRRSGGIHSPAFLDCVRDWAQRASFAKLGIDVLRDLPGVGKNLSNHAILFIGLLQSPMRGNRARYGRIRCRRSVIRPACPVRRIPTCTSTSSARLHGARSAVRSPISRRRCSKPMARGQGVARFARSCGAAAR